MRPPKTRSTHKAPPSAAAAVKPLPSPGLTAERKAYALLLVVVLAAYINTFGLGIALDGNLLAVSDQRIHAATGQNLKLIFTTDYWWPAAADRLYRPLTTLSFLVNYAVLDFGEDPAGYHAVNILLHALNAFLVFALARRLLKGVWPAFFAAALWTVHPVGVDSVSNIAGRADLLATAGVLGGLLFYDRVRRGASWEARMGLGLCAALAVFSKESGAALIGLMLLWDLLPGTGAAPGVRRRLPDYLLVGAVLGLYAWLRMRVFQSLPEPLLAFADNPLRGAGFWAARWTAVKILGMDLALLVWPARLTSDRSYNQIPIAGPGDPGVWLALVAVLAILGFAIARRGRDPLWFWAAGFFGLTLLPSSNLAVVIGAPMAERFLYLPSAAFAIAAAAVVYRYAPPSRAPLILGVLIALCAVRTLARNPDWKDTLTLVAHDSRVATESFRLIDMHGEFLFGQDSKRNLEEAIREVEKAWSILSPLPPERSNEQVPTSLGLYYLIKGDQTGSRTPEGQRWYHKGVDLLLRAERIARAIESDYDAAQLRHGKPLARRRPQQRVYFTLGDGMRAVGRNPDAIAAYRYGRGIDPTAPESYDGAASAYLGLNDLDMAALTGLEKALVLDAVPQSAALAAQVYRQIPDGACAVTSHGGVLALNTACPRVRSDMCRALPELSRTFSDARNPAKAAEYQTMAVEQYGCPAGR